MPSTVIYKLFISFKTKPNVYSWELSRPLKNKERNSQIKGLDAKWYPGLILEQKKDISGKINEIQIKLVAELIVR